MLVERFASINGVSFFIILHHCGLSVKNFHSNGNILGLNDAKKWLNGLQLKTTGISASINRRLVGI